MAEIRISKLAKEFNIGLSTVIEFLQKNGVSVEEGNPNVKVEVPDGVRLKLVAEFGSEPFGAVGMGLGLGYTRPEVSLLGHKLVG